MPLFPKLPQFSIGFCKFMVICRPIMNLGEPSADEVIRENPFRFPAWTAGKQKSLVHQRFVFAFHCLDGASTLIAIASEGNWPAEFGSSLSLVTCTASSRVIVC